MSPSWKRRIRIALLAVLFLILSCFVWAFFVEPGRLVVHQTGIQIDNWPQEFNGLRIALIADIHTGGPFIDDQKPGQATQNGGTT